MTKTKRKETNKVPKLDKDPTEKDFTVNLKKPVEFNARNPKQQKCYDLIDDYAINFIIGSVGSGKTHIAINKAISLLQSKQYKKIVLLRPACTTKREHLGFLKGGLEEKIAPLILPMKNLFVEAVGELNFEKMVESGMVEPFALEYIEGITYKNAVVIVDEFQNMDSDTLQAIMTRVDDSSKLLILGDKEQIKLKNYNESSFHDIWRFKDNRMIAITEFLDSEIVRGKITREVMKCWKLSKNLQEEINEEPIINTYNTSKY